MRSLITVAALHFLFLLPFIAHAQTPDEKKPAGPQTLEELPPEMQEKYKEARERLRKAKITIRIAYRQAEAADPALWAAHRIEREANEVPNDLGRALRDFEIESRRQGEEAHKNFMAWSKCVQKRASVQRMMEMAEHEDERPLLMWYVRYILEVLFSKMEPVPDELRAIGKGAPGDWTEEELLMALTWLSKHPVSIKDPRISVDFTCDCEKLAEQVNPTIEMTIAAWNYGRRPTALREINRTYISQKTPESIFRIEQLAIPINRELDAIFPNWRVYEKNAKLEQTKANKRYSRLEKFMTENMPSLAPAKNP